MMSIWLTDLTDSDSRHRVVCTVHLRGVHSMLFVPITVCKKYVHEIACSASPSCVVCARCLQSCSRALFAAILFMLAPTP